MVSWYGVLWVCHLVKRLGDELNLPEIIWRIVALVVTVAHSCISWSSQLIKISIVLSIDKLIKVSKSDLIDIDCIDQLVEIDDTVFSFIDLSWLLPISLIHIGRNICSSAHQKIKTEFMQKVNLLMIEWQLRSCKGSNIYPYIVYQTLLRIKKFLKNLIFSLQPGLKPSSDGWYWPGL